MIRALIEDFRAAAPAERTAQVGLLLFGLIGPLGPAAAMLSCLVLLGATLARPRAAARDLGGDPVFALFLVLGVYALIRAGFAANEFPSIAGEQWDEATDLLFPIFLLPVAWWLRGSPERVIALLTLALASFCLDMLIGLDWSRLPEFLDGQRNGITGSKLSTALYTGTAIVGLVAFAPRIARSVMSMPMFARACALIVLTLVGAMLLAAQYITLTRSVVLSLLVLVPLMIAFHWWQHREHRLGVRGRVVCALAAIVLIAVAAKGYDRVEQRFEEEAEVFAEIAEGDLSEVPFNSMGARIHLWRFGAELIGERPLFGWGPATRATRFLAPKRGEDRLQKFGDLHNEWMQILLWLGLTGVIVYLVLLGFLFRGGVRGYRSGGMPVDIGLFLVATMLLLAGWTLINSRLLNPDFQYYLVLVLGVTYTFELERKRLQSSADRTAAARMGPTTTDT